MSKVGKLRDDFKMPTGRIRFVKPDFQQPSLYVHAHVHTKSDDTPRVGYDFAAIEQRIIAMHSKVDCKDNDCPVCKMIQDIKELKEAEEKKALPKEKRKTRLLRFD